MTLFLFKTECSKIEISSRIIEVFCFLLAIVKTGSKTEPVLLLEYWDCMNVSEKQVLSIIFTSNHTAFSELHRRSSWCNTGVTF